MYLIFDTETTGFPKDKNAPITDTDNWPRMVQLAWQLHDDMGGLIEAKNYIVRPEGYDIPFNAEQVHGISTARALKEGMELSYVLEEFSKALEKTKFAVGHNIYFDIPVVQCEYFRKGMDNTLGQKGVLDTCTEETAELCKLGGGNGRRYKLPKLMELHQHLFDEGFDAAHNASADVEATARCFLELLRLGHFSAATLGLDEGYLERYRAANPTQIKAIGLNVQPYQPIEKEKEEEKDPHILAQGKEAAVMAALEELKDVPYCHIHNHTQYSILQATTDVNTLVKLAWQNKMPAVGLTDLGNMYGAFNMTIAIGKLNEEIEKHNKKVNEKGEGELWEPYDGKVIIGTEIYVAEDYKRTKFTKDQPDRRFQQVLLAKNKAGYLNLAMLSTEANTTGLYGQYARIGKEMIAQYRENLIATTGGLQGEVPQLILQVGEHQAEQAFKWWYDLFGDDLYVELLRNGLPENDRVNEVLLSFAKKYGVRYIAQNNTFYAQKKDFNAHDILLCIRDAEQQSTPIGRGRGCRFGFPNDEFYFKSQQEMKTLFYDLPDAIRNIGHLVDKVENFKLKKPVLLPKFDIPEQFKDPRDDEGEGGGKRGENAYLRYLTFEGAKKVYPDMDDATRERIEFELDIIAKTGYPGYFLIVQDFIVAARKMGVLVGPGRGSAAGSAVAYCIGITSIDPIKYDLLFERFLNPDRVSLPDIDTDFDDEGRGRIIDWVVDKYGKNQVAQIITYGTLAAKNSIRDTARAMGFTPAEINELGKKVPDISLSKLFNLSDKDLSDKLKGKQEEIEKANTIKELAKGDDATANIINQARKIEGSIKSLGVHACGVIITPSDIREHVPMATAKDSEMLVTQFDNKVVEDAGLLKMDFLGLKTLTLINDTINLIEKRFGICINPDEIPIDDPQTYELFQRGETVGVFQYESPGMQKNLRELKPGVFSDLIAMNALYRPGPMEYIPSFIRRKHGEEEISYDLPDMEEYLAETYGITVYQEQVMLLSQKLAGFTKGEADMLRKAMGKKKIDVLAKMKPKFIDQAVEKGHPSEKLEKIWKDWEAFAAYAFNKSHSTCYAWVAYQTAYLKANYPSEYMAAVLSNNMNDIKNVTFYMEEVRRMGIKILCPDVNESERKFSVSKNGDIRFGLGAVKNVGDNAISFILKDRAEKGPYTSIFDFTTRVDKASCSRRSIEHFVLSGAFDCFGSPRSAYFFNDGKSDMIEKAVRYGEGIRTQNDSAQSSLFGDMGGDESFSMPAPALPQCDEWADLSKLQKEREVVGLFISSHPLDAHRFVLEHYCNVTPEKLTNDIDSLVGQDVSLGGMITKAEEATAKNGDHCGYYTVEDTNSAYNFSLYGAQYLRFRAFLFPNAFIYIKGSVKPGWVNKDTGATSRRRFMMTDVRLLSEVPKDFPKKVIITIGIMDIDDVMVHDLMTVISSAQGPNSVEIKVVDYKSGVSLSMPVKEKKITLDQKIIDTFERISGHTVLFQ
ncbi:MAG: DNA polymerase III subunit alpha [Flavobacteriales bacterium]|nr:DNA polymerase III subunit alpha [Flavobacteriales bacterium]